MPQIQVLDQITIDKIAAGEVIERPASIVKELVENSIDAKAASVTVEIQDGGISLIRVTDNGSGIEREDIRNAFLRHSTSKIRKVKDLAHIASLGFRGEALSSISAVTRTELITKTKEDTFGTRYVIEGGVEQSLEDAGAPDGTTFLVRQLFYNVPARRKFLKTPMTEAGHVQDLLMRLALSHPEVAFTFINNGQTKMRTSGNGKLKDVIYSIYGREAAANLIELDYSMDGLVMKGYLGKPVITRGNRNFENYFVNGRYVKNAMLSKAIEDAYKDFLMQHKFPFVVIHFQVDGEKIDVNVHPTKMEMRFQRQQDVYNIVYEGVHRTLLEPELIPQVEAPAPKVISQPKSESPFLLKPKTAPRPMEKKPEEKEEPHDEAYFMKKMKERVLSYHQRNSSAEVAKKEQIFRPQAQAERIKDALARAKEVEKQPQKQAEEQPELIRETPVYETKPVTEEKAEQLNLFEEHLLKREKKAEYKLIGQVFETYWLVEFENSLYIIDQHAAHERVLYERTLKEMKNREFTAQYLSPPIILSLSMQEAQVLNENMDRFTRIGFEIEPFGGEEYAVRAIPDNLFGIAKKELLLEMLDDLADGISTSMTPELIDEKVASMSCKAAVKGNNRLSAQEADALIGELLLLENPYHCPHGRPTIIAMTQRELEKKFKRIV
ncbi:DNA mismatch repair endonuclease MutL [Mediterraneibacter gnavus]|uniref:DNA mismatch repair protein MutL n=1 Tax=Mediterraneibacter gnavus TaxID=33038 RepID=A0AAJ3KKF3_MEDGN|nr:DNA mismatch repair endonuclease MutL [Mediterraneibacter gnavus]NSC81709.1 DNA mismatch repair endonuclease MutL [Mediterraneibacter gnavus]NSI24614.1 DNA mismatch repair endonuclease MutL [Mediterraneibacter gnavus]NSI28080.1 DNA mismatch repair endonuclease MutL [Mediterraneibacter gnavus]NSI44014.1 DNA mismatch repair endonuclease MutL [Mediterraneibacter gnavus]NSI47439.1 DNA mismatch repair endonuclease MutL [Mediterraneibacter gnavus]